MLGRLARMGWRNLSRNKRRTWITVAALAGGLGLSNASWVLSIGYMQDAIDAVVGGTAGHLQVLHPGQLEEPNLFDVVEDTDGVIARLDADPRVEAVTARAEFAGLLSTGPRSAGALVRAVDPGREGGVTKVPTQVTDGRFVSGPGEVVLGDDLAAQLRAAVGEEVVVISQAADGSLANELWEVVGLVDTGSEVTDRTTAWVALDGAMALLALDGAHTVVARLHATEDAPAVVRDLAAQDGWTGVFYDQSAVEQPEPVLEPHKTPVDPEATWATRSWAAINPAMAEMVALTDVWLIIMVAIVLGAAGMGAMNTLLMSVTERTRELGILMAVGLKPVHVVLLTVVESLALAVLSTIIGTGLGLLLSWWLVETGIDLSEGYGDLVFVGVSMDPIMRGRWTLDAFVWPVAIIFVIAVLASVIPAIRAARLDPATAMSRR